MLIYLDDITKTSMTLAKTSLCIRQ